MIVPMSKVLLVARSADRDRLLETLRRIGVIHLEPVDPGRAVADEQTLEALGLLDSAIRIVAAVPPAGARPQRQALDAAREVVSLQKAIKEETEQLSQLARQVDQLRVWGQTRRATLEALQAEGVEVRLVEIAADQVPSLEAECLETVATLGGNRCLVALVDRQGRALPEQAKLLDWPAVDVPTLKQQAQALDASIQQNRERLGQLALLAEDFERARQELLDRAEFTVAQRSGLEHSRLYALQGWVPTDRVDFLGDALQSERIPHAVETLEPGEDEEPPTLIAYPKWTVPIKALFDMLGTLPGYREFDLSSFFMVALPLFAAMLIGDAGYGLVLAGAGLLFYGKLSKAAGKAATWLLIIFGLVTLVYGVLTGNVFGVTPQTLAVAGYEEAAQAFATVAPLWREDAEAGRRLIMQLSILIGAVHLVIAHLRRVVALWPDITAIAEIGWMVILSDMLAIIWLLMFPESGSMSPILGWVLLVAVLAVSWCSEPRGHPVKRILTGFAGSILPLLGTFSDIMSYIRLFAVGLASFYIADAFNGLGARVAAGSSWLLGAPIVVFGHVLNIALAAIAIFAHGVRLNMLEFSNNVGVKWAGYAYRPFTRNKGTSIGESAL